MVSIVVPMSVVMPVPVPVFFVGRVELLVRKLGEEEDTERCRSFPKPWESVRDAPLKNWVPSPGILPPERAR